MSTAEIKQTIEAMTEEERYFAASYLSVLIHRGDQEYRRIISQRMDRTAQGAKFTLDQALKIHETLEAEGL